MTQSTEYKHEHLLSEKGKNRHFTHFYRSFPLPDDIKAHPEPLELVGGVPNFQIFPVESIKVGLRSKPFPNGYETDAEINAATANTASKDGLSFDVLVDASKVNEAKEEDHHEEIDIKSGLQYSNTAGLDPLLKFTKDFTKEVIHPGYEDWNTVLTLGGANGAYKAFESVFNEGDVLLAQEFTFTPVVNSAKDIGFDVVSVPLDFAPTTKGA
ncbi:unnamed protein product [Ambrosiozyma monospora]|uniref:Unnamed protein product n=1 Tax=Ambrosiozyma monospora TaxID=43982 RepID=A0ACB5UC13_AMBMO|nr:unnamed protein product [Ambrosiozyma monospora]